MLDYGICTPQLQLVSTGGFGLLNGGASFSSSSPADPTRKPHLCLLPVLLFCLVLLSVRSAHLSCGALIFPNRLLIPPLSIWQRCRWTMQAGGFCFFFFFCCDGLDVCGLPMLPSQHHQHVTAAAVKWSMPLLLREYFPSGPLPNASDHCFCPRLPVWGWSKTLPRCPSPNAGGPTVACP